jgi:hypothetical protein
MEKPCMPLDLYFAGFGEGEYARRDPLRARILQAP